MNVCGGIRAEKNSEEDPEGNLLPVLKQYMSEKTYSKGSNPDKVFQREAQHELKWEYRWRSIHQSKSEDYVLVNLGGTQLIVYRVNHAVIENLPDKTNRSLQTLCSYKYNKNGQRSALLSLQVVKDVRTEVLAEVGPN